MPVILGPDGPSLGGFVCPATIVHAELWKMGQLAPGDPSASRFASGRMNALDAEPRSPILRASAARGVGRAAPMAIATCWSSTAPTCSISTCASASHALEAATARARHFPASSTSRPASARCRSTTTPRSSSREALLEALDACERRIPDLDDIVVPSRIVHLPLSWDDPATQLAIRKYMQSVRPDAPWCPSNIEFIRRINGLDSIDDVHRIVFDASYLVLGLGDVYLGAPVATPIDPRHRLVTTKYNPARTWTPENAVGIGGAYMCVYGMEGPAAISSSAARCRCGTRSTRFAALAAALLRSDPLLPGQRRGTAGDARRLSRTAAIRCASKSSEFRLHDYHAFLRSIAAKARAFKRASRPPSKPSASAGRGRRGPVRRAGERWRAPKSPMDAVPEGCRPVCSPVTASVWKSRWSPDSASRPGRS